MVRKNSTIIKIGFWFHEKNTSLHNCFYFTAKGKNQNTSAAQAQRFREFKSECVVCQEGNSTVRDISVPYVFLHLVSQLAAVNIKIKIDTKYEWYEKIKCF